MKKARVLNSLHPRLRVGPHAAKSSQFLFGIVYKTKISSNEFIVVKKSKKGRKIIMPVTPNHPHRPPGGPGSHPGGAREKQRPRQQDERR
jgi:hypothetical protein